MRRLGRLVDPDYPPPWVIAMRTNDRVFRAVSIVAVIIVAGIVASGLYVFYDVSMRAEDKGAPSGTVTPAHLARGKFLTRAPDCAACHSAQNSKPFAGGLPFKLPFG